MRLYYSVLKLLSLKELSKNGFLLFIAFFSLCFSILTSVKISGQYINQNRDLLGADLVVTGNKPMRNDWLDTVGSFGINSVVVKRLYTVLSNDNTVRLAQIKSVPCEEYPMYGSKINRLNDNLSIP